MVSLAGEASRGKADLCRCKRDGELVKRRETFLYESNREKTRSAITVRRYNDNYQLCCRAKLMARSHMDAHGHPCREYNLAFMAELKRPDAALWIMSCIFQEKYISESEILISNSTILYIRGRKRRPAIHFKMTHSQVVMNYL